MVQLLHDAQLMLEGVEGGSFLLVFLDGDSVALLINSELHSRSGGKVLSVIAGSKSTDDPVLIEVGGLFIRFDFHLMLCLYGNPASNI